MKEIFSGQTVLSVSVMVLLMLSLLCQLFLVYYMTALAKEAKELYKVSPKRLKPWIEEYLKEEKQIANISVFVEKKLQEFSIGKIPATTLKHISGQLLLLMIFLAGIGACKGIADGKTLGQILPFYMISLLALFLHFSISGVLNLEERKKQIKMNLVDFLENKKQCLYQTFEKEQEDREKIFGEEEDLELKEILREILA